MGGLSFSTGRGVTGAGVHCARVGVANATYTVGKAGAGVAMVPDVDATSSVLNGVWSRMLCHSTCDVEPVSESVCHPLMMMKAWVIRGVMTDVPALLHFCVLPAQSVSKGL
jgi:hypothetical protein